jgi:hypothetical protein
MRRRKFVVDLLFSMITWKRGIISHLIARAMHTFEFVMLGFSNSFFYEIGFSSSWVNYAMIMSYSH